MYWGGSHIVSPSGVVVAKAKYDEDDVVVAELDLGGVRRARPFLPMLSKDTRHELYDELLKQHEETRSQDTKGED
jgi:predicted amidohydrolase